MAELTSFILLIKLPNADDEASYQEIESEGKQLHIYSIANICYKNTNKHVYLYMYY